MTADECEFNTFRSVQDWRETIGSKALSVSFEFNNHQCFEKNVYKYIDIFFQTTTNVSKKNVYKYIDNFFQTLPINRKKMFINI